jgi:hypothetical protein
VKHFCTSCTSWDLRPKFHKKDAVTSVYMLWGLNPLPCTPALWHFFSTRWPSTCVHANFTHISGPASVMNLHVRGCDSEKSGKREETGSPREVNEGRTQRDRANNALVMKHTSSIWAALLVKAQAVLSGYTSMFCPDSVGC